MKARFFHRYCIKTISICLTFVFSFSSLSWPQSGAALWSQTKPEITLSGKPTLNGINIPYSFGTTQEAFSTGAKETIINIQDAHASLSAQESIVKILENLVENYDLDFIALEGASGPVDVSLLRTFPDSDIRKETAQYLMRKGKMSAGEFFTIVSENPITLYGIEDNALYRQNVESFRSAMERKLESVKEAEYLIKALDSFAAKIYSEDLLKFNQNAILHKDGKLPFIEYWNYMSKLAKQNNIEMAIFDNISKLVKTTELEKGINFQKANDERKSLIDELSKVLPKRELEKLVLESLSFKLGKISQGDFHKYLIRLAEDAEINPAPYANLISFTKYITIYEDVDLMELYREMEELEDYIREKLFRNDDERTLYNLTKTARTIKKLFDVSLTNSDYDFIMTKKRYFDRDLFSNFVKDAMNKYAVSVDNPYDLDKIFTNLNDAVEFYNIAQARNNAMISNTVNAMRENKEAIAALITGGFHSKGLSRLMKDKNLSYLIIMPKFEGQDQRPYIAVLTNKRQPYEELLQSGQYILAAEAYFSGNRGEPEYYDSIFYAYAGKARDLFSRIADLEEIKRELMLVKVRHYESHLDTWRKAGMPDSKVKPKDFARILGLEINSETFEIELQKNGEPMELKTGGLSIIPLSPTTVVIGWRVGGEFTHFALNQESGKPGVWELDIATAAERRAFAARFKRVFAEAREAKLALPKEVGRLAAVGISQAAIVEGVTRLVSDRGLRKTRSEIISDVWKRIAVEGKIKEGIDIDNAIVKALRAKGFRVPKEWRMNGELIKSVERLKAKVLQPIPRIVIAVPSVVAEGRQEEIRAAVSEAQGRLAEKLEVEFFEDRGGEAENLEAIKEIKADVVIPVRRDVPLEKLKAELVSQEFLDEVNVNFFRLVNPELADMEEAEVEAMTVEGLEHIILRLNLILSPVISQETLRLSAYNLRAANVASRVAEAKPLSAEAVAFVEQNRETRVVSIGVRSLYEAKLIAERHNALAEQAKRKQAVPTILQLRLIVPNLEEKEKIERNKEEILGRMGIPRDVLPLENLAIITEEEEMALSVVDIYKSSVQQFKSDYVTIASPLREDRPPTQEETEFLKSQKVAFLEYEGFAASHVYNTAIEHIAKQLFGWFVLPKLEKFDIRRDIEVYRKVLIAV